MHSAGIPALKFVWSQLHWLLGITAGIVLAVVGVTGGMLSFQDELMRLINPGVLTVQPSATAALPPQDLLARLQEALPGRTVSTLTLSSDRRDSVRVGLAPPRRTGEVGQAQGPRIEWRHADPYTGRLLGQPRGEEAFRTIRQVHRWLAAGDVGKQIVGASTVALVVLALSGLYLRWPRRPLDWRAWFRIDLTRRGRNLLWALHSVIGAWMLVPYLLMGLTGLYWSYDWYRTALFDITGAPRPNQGGMAQAQQRQGGGRPAAPAGVDLGPAWESFRREAPGFITATLRLPGNPGQPLQVTYRPPDSTHERATDTLIIETATGRVTEHRRYADLPAGHKVMTSMLPLHSGSFFGPVGTTVMMLASLMMPLFAITGWMLYLDRRRKKRTLRAAVRDTVAMPAGDPVLIAFASQSGTAERVAWQSAAALRSSGVAAAVEPLAALDAGRLAGAGRALFVVGTFGDGEAPDAARRFMRGVMGGAAALGSLRYGLLALGDRHYDQFCGFGKALDGWLQTQGASPLFARVEVDGGDQAALHHWRRQLGILGAAEELPDWDSRPFRRWRLAERRLLNPGSAGGPTFHLALEPLEGTQDWSAGDIAEIAPAHAPQAVAGWLAAVGIDGAALVTAGGRQQRLADGLQPLPHRDYSIASLPQDGAVHILVRQARRSDGRLGLASGWLTEFAAIGGAIPLRLRSNPGFHDPGPERPLILVGNGTGLAGLRAHLKARAAAGGRAWLLFGERNAATDRYYGDEIAAWQAQGVIERLDLVFSRDQAERVYVQHRLAAEAERVRQWVAAGAAILVCGSLEGMAPGVDAALADILGRAALDDLAAAGRYRRDVY